MSQNKPRDQRIVLTYFLSSVGFGIAMGCLFPVFAGFFVDFKSPALREVFVVSCIGAGLLVGLFSFLIGRLTVLRVIRSLAGRLKELGGSEGDLSRDIELRSSDCIGDLVAHFNAFQAKLRAMLQNLGALAERTKQVGFDLAANSTQTNSAAIQISQHMEGIQEQTAALLREIHQVDQARGGIQATSAAVGDHIRQQDAALGRLTELIRRQMDELRGLALQTGQRTALIEQSINASRDNLRDIALIARQVGEIDDSTAQIGGLIAQIDDTAERINVLGINASIEASHAGESGRGFGVVANEIRKLADLARGNSRRISERLELVLRAVADTVELSRRTEGNLNGQLQGIRSSTGEIRALAAGLDEFVRQADRMLAANAELVEASARVGDSMRDMGKHTDLISESMRVLTQSAQSSHRAISEISEGVRDISQEVGALHRVSGANAENVGALRRVIARFKVG